MTYRISKLSILALLLSLCPSVFGKDIQNSVISSGNNNIVISNTSGGVVIIDGVVVSGGSAGVVVGAGPIETVQRTVPSFTGVRLDAPANVIYTVGGEQKISIKAQKNIADVLVTRVDKGVLIVEFKGSTRTKEPVSLSMTGSSLTALQVNGSGSMEVKGVSNTSLRAEVSGSGSISVAGASEALTAEVSGSGGIDASLLKSKRLVANISGSGHIHAQAAQAANVNLSGSSVAKIFGKPTTRHVEKSGSGRVVFDGKMQ
jgi:Putative auto-transporter adhesin, head GIN domain